MLWITDFCGCAMELHTENNMPCCDSVVRACKAHEGITNAQELHDTVLAESSVRQRALQFINEASSIAAMSSDIVLADGSKKTVFIDDLDAAMKPVVALMGTAPVKKSRQELYTFFDADRKLNVYMPDVAEAQKADIQEELVALLGAGVNIVNVLPEGQQLVEKKAAENMTL